MSKKCTSVKVIFYAMLDNKLIVDYLFENPDIAFRYKELVENEWKSLLKVGYFDEILEKGGPNFKHTLKKVEVIVFPETNIGDMEHINLVQWLVDVAKFKED